MSNNQNQKPIYVGSGVEKFDGDLIEVSVCLSDLPAEHRFEYNGKWYAKLKINRKEKQMNMVKHIQFLLTRGSQSRNKMKNK